MIHFVNKFGLDNEIVILITSLMFLLMANFYQFKGGNNIIKKKLLNFLGQILLIKYSK